MRSPRTKAVLTPAAFAFAFAVIVLAATSERAGGSPAGEPQGHVLWGTWALALDATPFGIPGGFLPGVFTFHRDGTLSGTDGGDIGSVPFTTTDTTQQGVWVQAGRQFYATSLFLRKDRSSGEIEGWHRVRLALRLSADGNQLSGVASEDVLECHASAPTPFKLLNCPDPITGTFTLSPFPIPVQFRRLGVIR